MNRRRKIDSREIGLEIGLILGKHLADTEHLHYGYWTDGLEVRFANLPRAQEAYCHFLISHIPQDAKTILDVGCGSGRLALMLSDRGCQVDCVSPSPLLAARARDLLGERSHIFECSFEALETERRYDVVLFSESFQYVRLEKALENSLGFLNDRGHLLVCDFFKRDTEGQSLIGGGHKLARFRDLVAQHPFEAVEDIDITQQTAPTLDVVNDLLVNAGVPIWSLCVRYLDGNYPLLYRSLCKFAQWKYKKKIDRFNRKYLSGARNAQTFARLKSYRLLLYRKAGSGTAGQSAERG